MGIWSTVFGRTTATLGLQSPYAPSSDLVTFAATEILGEMAANGAMTREIALRVPGVKRAHGIHCSIFAGLPFYLMEGDVRAAEQPKWLTNSQSGLAPYHRLYGIASDQFFNGWGCQAFSDDYEDAIHVPWGSWGVEEDGTVKVTDAVPDGFRKHAVAIPLGYGSNGILVDGIDTIRAALDIEQVWMQRVKNPLPATELHITDPIYDNMSAREQRKLVRNWNANRALDGGQTAVTKSFLTVNALGTVSADLFEKGRNAIRLDLANHSAVPASIIEGAKDGGGSDINYSNDATARNELYDFGTKAYVQAYEARMSLDDVCVPGASIRADLSNFMSVPSPDTNPTSTD